MLLSLVLVGTGGFLGALARYQITQVLNSSKHSLPFGTLFVNLVGSFLLGILAGFTSNESFLLFLGVGFLGSFTTFSTLKFEWTQFKQQGQRKLGFIYILISYTLSIGLAFLGLFIGHFALTIR